MFVFGEYILFNEYLISSFSLILIVVLILYYIVSKRIRIPIFKQSLERVHRVKRF